MWNKRFFKKILILCSPYHAIDIDSNKWGYCKVLHIDGRMSPKQSYGI
jgi:hypothetical protein